MEEPIDFTTNSKEDIDSLISTLKNGRLSEEPDIETYKKEYYIEEHDVFDETMRPNKIITDEEGTRIEFVNRIAVPLQKRIVESAISFLFGNPVTLQATIETDKQQMIFDAITKIMFANKTNSFDRKVARELFRATEVAECWYPVKQKEKHNDYGFETDFKLRCKIFSPWNGQFLFPYFDENNDLVAFSREFIVENAEGKKIECFEVFEKDRKILFAKNDDGYEKPIITPISIGKIPIVFAEQELTEWNDVQSAINRLEKLLSNFAETIDYHADPKIFVEGKIMGFAKKGQSGAIVEGSPGSKAYYLSWQHAPESVKLEIETLLRIVFGYTQTPDVSFDSVKGLQAISGVTLKMMFMDAHLKVLNKQEIFDEYLQRRLSIIKAYIGQMNNTLLDELNTFEIKPVISPYMIDDFKLKVETLLSANGDKPLISHKSSIAAAGFSSDTDGEFEEITKEQQADRTFSLTEPTL